MRINTESLRRLNGDPTFHGEPYPRWFEKQKLAKTQTIPGSIRLKSPPGHVPIESRFFGIDGGDEEIQSALAKGWTPA